MAANTIHTLAMAYHPQFDIEFENKIKGFGKLFSSVKGPLLSCGHSGNESIYLQNI